MVCCEHDLTVYSTNYQESQSSSALYSEKDNNLIWEGHGLMSWVMEDQHNDQIFVTGKLNHQHIDVRLELQPVIIIVTESGTYGTKEHYLHFCPL